ncbi:MAG: sialate O-acetylesterase [Verrucomicrobiaceae bacterium]|nr:sialate O-acetylesterase [Verrucomicrobiaceae bacterium]
MPNVGTQTPQTDFKGDWKPCSPETIGGFSAVGYFFGRTLHRVLDVPVGLINDSWGGSAAEAWVRRDVLEQDPRFKLLMENTRRREAELSSPEGNARFLRDLAAWQKHSTDAKKTGSPFNERPPQPPDAWLSGNARPGNIFNGVLLPTIGYGIKGVIWYQGESNAGRAYEYGALFPRMIQHWREEWKQGDFPFYWVQLGYGQCVGGVARVANENPERCQEWRSSGDHRPRRRHRHPSEEQA